MRVSKVASSLLVTIGLLIGFDVHAYPTVWKVSNDTNRRLEIVCKSTSVVGLAEIKTPALSIEPHKSFNLNWGAAWYNDGMGLNQATWTCHEQKSPQVVLSGQFETGWDESVLLLLKIDGERLSIQKTEPKAPVAKGQRNAK